MHAKWDDTTVKLTPRYKRAIEDLMAATCEMMREAEPRYAQYWTWGRCEVTNLARTDGLRFTYGGDADRPKGKRFAVTTRRALRHKNTWEP